MNYILSYDDLTKQLKVWLKKFQIFVPTQKNGDFSWQKIDITNFDLSPIVTTIPPKKFFLPDNEILFNFFNNKILPVKSTKPTILLGLGIIDLKAIALLDKVMVSDEYYQKKRSKTVLIGLGPQIFDEKFDLFLQNQDGNWLVYIGSPKGQRMVSPSFRKTVSDPIKIEKIIDPLLSNQGRILKAVKASYQDKIWDELAQICLGCGICTYVCPLCYCFSLDDKINLNTGVNKKSCSNCQGSRRRVWDSCMLAHFSQVAGKHNFRVKLRDRIYNWYHHKFVRFPMEYGRFGCVNCGRCIKYCPAKINYRLILEKLLKKYV